ncbi:FAD dependent oxidoreductase [Xylogone sp. PMI_703]|nr:FAD dependent oxidoreductase [Xylogone sp. PMI_703]
MANPERIVIVGAGIVGSALAYFLSTNSTPQKREIVVVERSLNNLAGSTAYAPGLVGQFNESEVLTKLAIESVAEYVKIPDGFDAVGGLEIATSDEELQRLKSRCQAAGDLGLSAEMVTPERAVELAPALVRLSDVGAALHFTSDGTANPRTITSFYQEEARKKGVQFVEADIEQLARSNGQVTGVEFQGAKIAADIVILATGIWAQGLCSDLDLQIPVVPVAHPYAYSTSREPDSTRSPWVRWPEYHVYARDHGTSYGFGTYNHEPTPYKLANGTALGDWDESFDEPLERARSVLALGDKLTLEKKFNGVFSMTPDNLPLVGKVSSVGGLYMAVAVWITHAAGAAKLLTKLIQGEEVDSKMRVSLNPTRFHGQSWLSLQQESLKGYNDIYKTDQKD